MVEDELEVFDGVDIDQMFELGPGAAEGRNPLSSSREGFRARPRKMRKHRSCNQLKGLQG